MKKYKVLITGKNNSIVDDLFNHMRESFIFMTTSMRYEDMDNHLDYFQPEIFIYCSGSDTREDINKLVELKRKITRQGIAFVLIGSKEDCDNFQKVAVYMADLVLEKPITLEAIQNQIRDYMEQQEREKEEQEALQKKLEEIKEQERRKHVLVIDDDPLMLKLIKEHLHENYDVATAISGKIAYKFLESKHTDLILLDYEMPVENGPQVLENLRQNPDLGNTPVVFLTGITDREKIRQALLLKPQGYLLKPIDKEKLIGTIEKYIG